MIRNKGKHLYKVIPMWMNRENVESDQEIEPSVKQNPWILQNVKWDFSLSMPRWMWLLIGLIGLVLIFI